MKTYLQEFPNPQFERTNWQNLNGMWDFGFNKAERGFKFSADEKIAVQLCSSNQYTHKINVTFCIESELSGIGYTTLH